MCWSIICQILNIIESFHNNAVAIFYPPSGFSCASRHFSQTTAGSAANGEKICTTIKDNIFFTFSICLISLPCKNRNWNLGNIRKLPLSGFSCDTLVEAPLGNLKFISMATSLRTTDLLYSEYNTNISIVHFWNFYGTKFEFINTYGSFRQLIDIYIFMFMFIVHD